VRKALLAERLFEPLSRNIIIKDKVRDAFRDSPNDLRVQINQSLDALSAHLDGIQATAKSKTFKKLKGNPVPPASHELYVTSGAGAKRLFGHYKDGQFVIDDLADHL